MAAPNSRPANRKYATTAMGVMSWAASELEHVGRIASVKDVDIQYSYALSTVNSMLHLRDALVELINDPYYVSHREDLTRTHDSVVRVVKKLIADYSVNIETIRAFNTRRVLGNLSNFQPAPPAVEVAIPTNSKNARPANASTKPANASTKPANASTRPANASPWYWPF